MELYNQETDLKNGKTELGFHQPSDVKISVRPPSQPVTYSWENMEVYLEIAQGNCFSRMRNKTPPIQKKILDNGNNRGHTF